MAKKPASPKPKRKTIFTALSVRAEDGCPELADRLANLLAAEKGVPVQRYTAVKIALEEAVARRQSR